MSFFLTASLSSGAVIISCQDLGNHIVQLSYDASGESFLVRAFALNITISDGVILSIGDYFEGPGPGYGIFPGDIMIPPVGDIGDLGTPIVGPENPGALGGIGTDGMTLEFGSLYAPGAEPPPVMGVLTTFTVSEDCTVFVAEENLYRGGVVLEDGTHPTVLTYGCEVVPEPATIFLIGVGTVLLRRKKV
ncbi:MAG: hypothetical protein A2Y10_00250 [Planctomycetes bacterium GWF2_41_51]|nr:MAG: hypothetical protein A2Y10_00250 [Planctomycetes bacterium GWF2_41_51]HBG27524.1 hypothetical protein [Phycisphaerales bacterium]